MKKNLQHNRGFTLIETLVYIALIVMIVTSVVGYSLSLGESRAKNYVVQNVQANSRTVLSVLSEKIRMSASVSTPTAGASSNQLILTMPNSAPNVIFSLSGGRIVMSVVGSPDVYLTDSRTTVSDLIFTNNSLAGQRGSVSIAAAVSYNGAAGDTGYTYSQQLRTAVTRRQ